MRKLFTILAIVGLGYVAVKSPAGKKVRCYVEEQVKTAFAGDVDKSKEPTRDKLKAVRQEIDKMDKEIDGLIRPMAEYMASIAKLQKEITTTEGTLAERKDMLKTLAKDVSGGAASLVYGGKTFSADRIEAKLKKDFETFQRLEAQLKAQKETLEAKQTALHGVQEQMAKATAKKREFEVRVAQLEADEELLQIAKMGTKLQIDQSLTTRIEAALADIADNHSADREEVRLRTGGVVDDGVPVPPRGEPRMDPASILRYLEGAETTASK